MRNRYYDPSAGRFTQEDPIGLAGGLNLYGFAAGDPVNFSDPFGLFAMDAEDLEEPQQGDRIPPAMRRVSIGGGYTVMRDPSRLGGMAEHYSVRKGKNPLNGRIIAGTGEVVRHNNKEPNIPKWVVKELVKRGWIPDASSAPAGAAAAKTAAQKATGRAVGGRILGILGFLLLVDELHAPEPPRIVRPPEPVKPPEK